MTGKARGSIEERIKAARRVAPFGFRWEADALHPDEREAPIRRTIFDLFAQHRRKDRVAKILNQAGHRTRSGHEFRATGIERVLMSQVGAPDQPGWGIVSNEVLDVVPADLWERCNAILFAQKEPGRAPRKSVAHLFSGLVQCNCGSPMYVPDRRTTYVCQNCRNTVGEADLEAVFVGLIEAPAGTTAGRAGPPPGAGGPMMREVIAHWPRLLFEERRQVVECLVARVVAGQNELSVHWKGTEPSREKSTKEPRKSFSRPPASRTVTPDDFRAKWGTEAEALRRRNATVSAAELCEEILNDFDAFVAAGSEVSLNLQEAAAESGYSPDHLGALVRQGKIPNAGRPNAPRIRRSDLPRKPSSLRPPSRDIKLVGATPGQIARAVVNSEKGAKR